MPSSFVWTVVSMPLSTFLAMTVASTITALLGSNTRPVTAARSPCAETEAASPNMVTIVKTKQTTEYRLLINLPISQDFPASEKVTVSHIFLYISRDGGTCTKGTIPFLGRHSLDGTEAIVSWTWPSRLCGWAMI